MYIYYTYRPDGLRHSIGDKVHVWDGANIVADVDGNDISVYIRGANLICVDDGNIIYYHFNAHGDVVALTNENGTKTKSYAYSAFGVEYSPSDFDDNPFRYCGEYFDKETNTIYLRARYYNAEQGRFTQEDPIKDGYNWYSYCGGNPVMFVDPSGYRAKFYKKRFPQISNIHDVVEKDQAFHEKITALMNHFMELKKTKIVQYDVPLYNQGNLSLCWAYCQTMVEDYQNGTVKTQEEADARAKEIAIMRHGEKDENGKEIWNRGGWPRNLGKIFKPNGIEALFNLLRDGPMYAFYQNAITGESHLVVVTGVNLIKGTVSTNNPWGYQGKQTYEEFLNGFLGMPSSYGQSLCLLYSIK